MLNEKILRHSFFGAAFGTLIEYYDYSLFTLFLPIIAPLFFPSSSPYESLVKSFNVLLIAMVSRPLGGLFFGYLGDAFGRRKALLTSMYGIAIATIVIGFIPSYAQFGIGSIIILMIAKTIQIFCFGGEYNGAGIYVVEHAQSKNEGYIGSLLSAVTLIGSLIASVIGIIITFAFMPEWSWRIAFILGGVVGISGILYRKNLLESPHFKQADAARDNLKNMLRKFPLEIIAGGFVGGFATVPFTTVFTFVAPVLLTKGFFTNQQFMIVQSLLIALAIVTLIIAGKSADKKSPAKVMQFGSLILIFLSYPVFLMLDKLSMIGFFLVSITMIVSNEILLGPSNAFLKNLFPMEYRYRGSSFSFTLGMSVFGGLTPIVENYLYQRTSHFSAASVWLIFLGIGTWCAIALVNNKQKSVVANKIIMN
ncbi:MAG: MFS transporter [Gammaproteobacteria bacterium]|nr:MFS transporter [Gammaproteobacteria bacterium]